MPSPIAHTMIGYVIYRIFQLRMSHGSTKQIGSLPLLAFTIGLSLLPDLDSVIGIWMGDFWRFHNQATHSLIIGLIIALGIGAVIWLRRRSGFLCWFIIALLCYELHVIMDFFTLGRGVMLLWPFSSDRYESSVKLFYGFHWSQGWVSVMHLWTLVTELGFVVLVGFIMHFLRVKKLLGG